MEQNLLLELLDHRLTLGVVSLLEVTGDVVHLTTVGQGNDDALVHLSLGLVHLFDDGNSDLLDVLHLTLEITHSHLESLFCQVFMVLVDELVASKGTLHSEYLDELLLAALVVVLFDDVDHTVPDGVRDIHTDALTHQGVTALRIDYGTLLVHHIVVLQQTLTDAEVVLLNFLLGTFHLFGNH